ncbi:hypothetical protein ACUY3K_09105 [Corynebacterium uberis]|uniref:hypothetical protein n=1 Tax=Corynebacterium TaxID=1716 RepID=UPI001D0A9F9B|nr:MULTISPECIES: hypothetical protein [Corynebacterium]MCZ9308538.1 hypothetical protein [Corynebacterium sp. c6VSa_13]UDL74190.1 hypothetical protein LH391_02975 [Corynebacterium uberis]UDL74927.1 hypothetical protein LH393_06430 [Corynebacterium uberis]UDL77141.1 hypothetical protein LH394_06420 [Corynebacterium uberis]UDL79424.1 hypothetical protein LH392_06835 [Corynebacterium uberis]
MGTIAIIVVTALVTIIAAWAYFTAQRLNRLHIRTAAALQALRAALDHRAHLVVATVPEAQEAANRAAAIEMSYATLDARAVAEVQVEEALRDAPERQDTQRALVDASTRVELARRFYNDAVTDTRALRTRPLVRALRLGGTARLPEYFEQVHVPSADN